MGHPAQQVEGVAGGKAPALHQDPFCLPDATPFGTAGTMPVQIQCLLASGFPRLVAAWSSGVAVCCRVLKLCCRASERCCRVSGPTISHHLKVLREAGLIDGERRGTWIYYRPVKENLRQLAALLDTRTTARKR